MKPSSDLVKVWDPLVRVGHWTIVISFLVAYLTEDELLTAHTWAGYLLAAVVLLRILWGFIGTPHARFVDFIYRPQTVLRYLADLLKGGGKRYIGHSPAGGAMILALLVCLVATSYTGLELLAVEQGTGPLAQQAAGVLPAAMASDAEHGATGTRVVDEEAEEFWEELHEFFANFTLLLVVLHVAGVWWAGRVHRENLPLAMITGVKRKD